MNSVSCILLAMLFAACSEDGSKATNDITDNGAGDVVVDTAADKIDEAIDVAADTVLESVEVTEAMSLLSRDMTPSEAGIQALTDGNRAFAFNIYQKVIAENPGKNVFVSPHSISVALAMTYAGALGDTATQMKNVLHFGTNDSTTHESFNALDLALASRGTEVVEADTGSPFQLSIVNAAWGQIDYPFLSTYLDVLALNYGAGMYLLDFLNNPSASRTTINDWVALHTMDRILNLLPQGSIDDATRLVLTNVIYFKANWLNKFIKELTVDDTFTRADDSAVTAHMMKKEDDLMYGIGDNYQLVEVPYVGNKVSMVLVLPDAGKFATVEAGLTGTGFSQMMASAVLSHGFITLPRFTFRFESSLNDVLKALGMTDAFDSNVADFSGMNGILHSLFISLVYHKSFVAVDEDGTEAAAATAVVVSDTSIPAVEFDIKMNRPFLFAMVDKPTGALLFLGRGMDPTEE